MVEKKEREVNDWQINDIGFILGTTKCEITDIKEPWLGVKYLEDSNSRNIGDIARIKRNYVHKKRLKKRIKHD